MEDSLARDGVKLALYGVEHVKDYIVAWKKLEGGRELKVLAPPSVSWGMVHQVKMAISVRGFALDVHFVLTSASKEKIDIITCPVEAAKAIKNPTEIQGFRNAYLRDGAATVCATPVPSVYAV